MTNKTTDAPALYRLCSSAKERDKRGTVRTSAEYLRLIPIGGSVGQLPFSVRIEGPDLDPDILGQGDFEIIIRRVTTDV